MGRKRLRKRGFSKITVRHADGRVETVSGSHFREPPRRPRSWYIRTDHWKEVRRQARIRDEDACVQCGAYGVRLEVHHLTYDRVGRELLEDVMTLCQPCHAAADDERRAAAA